MADDERTRAGASSGRLRFAVAVGVGLAGSAIIWVATPYSNFVIGASYISDSYLPVAAAFLTLVLVLVVNPLLRLRSPSRALARSQLAIAAGIMLVASTLPSSGMLRMLPYSLANEPLRASRSHRVAETYRRLDPPPGLFPGPLAQDEPVPAARAFIDQLPPDEPVPWGAWLPPLASWGVMLLSCWLMMIGLAGIVTPQWRENERLAFPLLGLHDSLLASPEPGRLLPELFRSPSFWIAAAVVFALHLLAGLRVTQQGGVPAIPINWNLNSVFQGRILRYTPG
jgi:hypothetical protein